MSSDVSSLSPMNTTSPSGNDTDLLRLLAQVSTAALQAELAFRQDEEPGYRPACGSVGKNRGYYNTSLHVWAVVIILGLSVFACAFPIAVRRFPSLPIPHRFIFLSRHFGTGVLIATAFVHLLPTAFTSLTDPCLPPFWNETYPAMAGLVAMGAVLVVVGVEQFFASKGAGHSHDHGGMGGGEGDGEATGRLVHENGGLEVGKRAGMPRRSYSARRFHTENLGGSSPFTDDAAFDTPLSPNTQRVETNGNDIHPQPPAGKETGFFAGRRSRSLDHDQNFEDEDLELDELHAKQLPSHHLQPYQRQHHGITSPFDPNESTAHLLHLTTDLESSRTTPIPHSHSHTQQTTTTPITPATEAKEVLQIMLLEAGILFHSIFIGISLSVATGTPFLVLLIAISFHQTFEGLALGARIAAITAFNILPHELGDVDVVRVKRGRRFKPWLMALAYGTTTPLGQLIGLGLHNLYDPASETGLLMVGVTNAVSSGLLLFAGLVELLAEDFLSDKSLRELRGGRRRQACGAVVAGGACMAFVGAWA